ncbi:voltage-dependent calcium channel subunit alpha-2/delta-3-like [Epargyreus clarus]|uniref:voltage-dependent calcium channel subunit alpha-2/delta-3-like n=1 Tax=Epargyreus clarus TaxID=520877 RepID=UPI003C2E5779
MNRNLLFLVLLYYTNTVISKNVTNKPVPVSSIKKSLEEHQFTLTTVNKSKTKSVPAKITNVVKTNQPIKPIIANKKKKVINVIPPDLIKTWASEISEKLFDIERRVVRRDVLLKSFSDIKVEVRNGSAIVEKAAKALEDLLIRRGQAADAIMRKAEELAAQRTEVPPKYTFDSSIKLDVFKPLEPAEDMYTIELTCKSSNKVKLQRSERFDGMISLETTSVYVAAEVFECDPRVIKHLYWSEGLLKTFRENYAQDATLDFQYMCSAKGFLRHYPAALWENMYKLKTEGEDLYDCRLRPWYVSASGAPRDVLILLDASGSMHNSSNRYIAEQFALSLLSALTDDDKVNVLRFNIVVESPISCFNEKLVSANHVNTAAMMAALKHQKMKNETKMADVLTYAVRMLQTQRKLPDRPPACQQAIVLLTDSLYDNYTDLLRQLDPEGQIRLFVLWLHDPNGLRDNTRQLGQWVSCARDGYFAELTTHADVTEQVMNILRVMERPLVGQRKHRLKMYSDVYAHVEDPRRGEFYWQQKENEEQAYRYKELRKNKNKLLNGSQMFKDFMHMASLEKNGYYYEGQDINYRLQVSVSVPVFDSITLENITIKLDEEKQRNSTRTYPVNRLLGVAGVDIPIDHLKLIFPYFRLGPGGSLFLVDHRGNIVFHDNTKPVFNGDILKPGYRTVDFLDLEQPAGEHTPRHFPREWLDFRKLVVIDQTAGNKTMYSKNIFEGGMRATLEMREYYWRRVLDHYTVVVVLPTYNTRHAVPDAVFTKELADAAYASLSKTDFSINPDWLYCRHVEPHFDTPEEEVLHFIKRRRDEPNFAMQKLKHLFSPIPPTLLEKTYQCNEELMARLSKEAVATDQWAQEHAEQGTDRDCSTCELGSTTAFFASESGLTRWQHYPATSAHAEPPAGSAWSRGPAEPWFRRAAAAPAALLVHAPVAPLRTMRNSDAAPPPLDVRYHWLTAARTLGHPSKGIIGVAGYHFHPQHLEELLASITNFPCMEEDESECEPRCDGVEWSCVVVDEGGWVVVSNGKRLPRAPRETPLREHLANLHPAAMAAMLNASVFKLNWIHDYQGVCFPPKDEKVVVENGAAILPTIMTSIWSSTMLLLFAMRELAPVITLLGYGGLAAADTQLERDKRRQRVQRDYERERFERLFDPRVLVNRTRFAACDRSRALYVLQRTPKAMEALRRPPIPCIWPLTGAVIPHTNLLLLAIYNNCTHHGRPLNDPLINEQVLMSEVALTGASRLACWRNRVSLPARPPPARCFPHRYAAEVGYRQCGEWLPDPEVEDAGQQLHIWYIIPFLSTILTYYMMAD